MKFLNEKFKATNAIIILTNCIRVKSDFAKSKTNCCDISLSALISLLIVDWLRFNCSAISGSSPFIPEAGVVKTC
jgi:hypothetical protein